MEAELAYFGWAHLGVAGQLSAFEAFQLALAGGLHPGADGFGILDVALVGELLVIDARDFDVDVDAVDEGAADLLVVAGDGHRATAALFDGVAVIAAGAPVQVAVGKDILHGG